MAKVGRKPGPGKQRLQNFLHGLGDGAVARVGWLDGSKYPNGYPVAAAAAGNEFGVPQNGIPPRPFMRPTAQEQKGNWGKLARQGAERMLDGSMTIGTVMEGLGLQAQGDIAKKITEITAPALKPSTVKARARKHSNAKGLKGWNIKPLVDTGTMLNQLTHDVVEK